MTKYDVPDDHWEDNESEDPPAWREDTSADIKIDVQLHDQGYQNDEKWTVHVQHHPGDDRPQECVAGFAVKHRNKGNYWRRGEMHRDSVDFVDLPLRVRRRVAAALNRDLSEITPDSRTIHREDGTGLGDCESESASTEADRGGDR